VILGTLPNDARVQIVTFTPWFSTICNVKDVPFYGTLEIVFRPADTLLEFCSFEEWLRSLAKERMTIEDLCRLVYDRLREALGDIPMRVSVHAHTTAHAPASASISSLKEA
jgi:NADPH-dependent 7-cyano-7-deazaguanine reductase QueF